jgi:hypothetical protein
LSKIINLFWTIICFFVFYYKYGLF